MIIEPVPWFSDRKICPADFDLAEYINQQLIYDSIIHLGPGYDHYLAQHTDAEILAITHSPAEMASYMSMIIAAPQVAQHYMVVFCDLYHLNPNFIPKEWDLLTLFHLGERESVYPTRLADLIKFINPKKIALYKGSKGFIDTLQVVQESGLFFTKNEYKSLWIIEQ